MTEHGKKGSEKAVAAGADCMERALLYILKHHIDEHGGDVMTGSMMMVGLIMRQLCLDNTEIIPAAAKFIKIAAEQVEIQGRDPDLKSPEARAEFKDAISRMKSVALELAKYRDALGAASERPSAGVH